MYNLKNLNRGDCFIRQDMDKWLYQVKARQTIIDQISLREGEQWEIALLGEIQQGRLIPFTVPTIHYVEDDDYLATKPVKKVSLLVHSWEN